MKHFFEVIHSVHFSYHSFIEPSQCTSYKHNLKVWSFIAPTHIGMSVRCLGSSYTKFETSKKITISAILIIQGGSNMTRSDLCVNKPHCAAAVHSNNSMGKSVSYGDTLPHTVVGVCGEFRRTGRFLQRGIWSQCVVPRSAVPSARSSL